MRSTTRIILVAAVSAGTMLAGMGVASAKGRPTASPATGTASCSVHANLSFNPPLQSAATGTSDVMLNAQLTKCSASSVAHRTTGHVHVDLGSIPGNTCTLPATTPAFTGLDVRWTPATKVAGSQLSSAAGGAIGTDTNGMATISFTDLAVAGSFTEAAGSATLSLTSTDTVANYQAACSGTGLDSIALRGSGVF